MKKLKIFFSCVCLGEIFSSFCDDCLKNKKYFDFEPKKWFLISEIHFLSRNSVWWGTQRRFSIYNVVVQKVLSHTAIFSVILKRLWNLSLQQIFRTLRGSHPIWNLGENRMKMINSQISFSLLQKFLCLFELWIFILVEIFNLPHYEKTSDKRPP